MYKQFVHPQPRLPVGGERLEPSQPSARVGFDPKFPPLKDAVFESAVAQRRPMWCEDDEGERFRDRAFVELGKPRDRLRAGVGVIKHAWRGWRPVVDGRLKPAFRDRRLVWDRNMAGRPEVTPLSSTAEKAAGLVGVVGCDVALDGRTDRRRDDNCPDRPGNHTTVSRRCGTVLSGRRVSRRRSPVSR